VTLRSPRLLLLPRDICSPCLFTWQEA